MHGGARGYEAGEQREARRERGIPAGVQGGEPVRNPEEGRSSDAGSCCNVLHTSHGGNSPSYLEAMNLRCGARARKRLMSVASAGHGVLGELGFCDPPRAAIHEKNYCLAAIDEHGRGRWREGEREGAAP